MSWKNILDQFIIQANTENLKTNGYPKEKDKFKFKMNVSFGKGQVTDTPWIAFRDDPNQQVRKGFYVVYLYYKDLNLLILAYGVSEENRPEQNWPDYIVKDAKLIRDFFMDISNQPGKTQGKLKDYKYLNSWIFKKYRVEIKNDNAVSYYYYNVENSHPIAEEELEKDLNSILEQYQEALDYYKQSNPKQLEPKHTLQKNDAYSVKDIVNEGCFLDQKALECILERFRDKKNLILQGPPGTGKSWLAKRLAFALMGARDFTRIRAVQFHPNLSYEDFIRGWRPAGDGKLALVDGPFMEIIEAAKKDADNEYVVVIEEINRGNPAQIFGEMLTLLEADKRKPEEALELSYKRAEKESVFVPENLYVIGTMNIADRSLALVDFAFRRRFAFVELMPLLDGRWPNWVHENCKIKREIVEHIAEGIKKLNEKISKDRTLGPQCQIGHSYVTPNKPIPNPKEWFSRVIETEIEPLLEEYWFDSPTELKDAKGILEDAKKRIQA